MARTPSGVEDISFGNLSDSDLRELTVKLRQEQQDRFSRDLDELRLRAREAGYEIVRMGEMTGKRSRQRSQADASGIDDQRRAVQPKYRNSENSSETWSGRGRVPRWMRDKLRSGKTREEFLIPELVETTA